MRRRVAPSLPYNWRPSDAGEGGTRGRDARASSCEERAKPSADLSPNVIQVSGYARSICQLIRRMIAIREDIAMAFFKREVGPVERFESALKDKQAARQKLADRLGIAETELAEKRVAAERLAVAGATNAQLDRAEANMRAVEDRARTLRAALAEFDEQIVSTERALADAKAQRDRELVADQICWELRTVAVRTRAGNANIALPAPPELEQPPAPGIERQLIYTLNPLLWREGNEVRRVPAFAVVGLPKILLPIALRHQHVDYLNARRVQTLMHVHGSGEFNSDPDPDDPQLVDLDALAAGGQESPRADVA